MFKVKMKHSRFLLPPAAPAGGTCEWEASEGSELSLQQHSWQRTDPVWPQLGNWTLRNVKQKYRQVHFKKTCIFSSASRVLWEYDTQQCVDDPSLFCVHVVTCHWKGYNVAKKWLFDIHIVQNSVPQTFDPEHRLRRGVIAQFAANVSRCCEVFRTVLLFSSCSEPCL